MTEIIICMNLFPNERYLSFFIISQMSKVTLIKNGLYEKKSLRNNSHLPETCSIFLTVKFPKTIPSVPGFGVTWHVYFITYFLFTS